VFIGGEPRQEGLCCLLFYTILFFQFPSAFFFLPVSLGGLFSLLCSSPHRVMADVPPVVTLADVEAAAARLDGVAHVTPLLTCLSLDVALSGGTTHFYFKAEALQRTGSFKFRGAYNAVAALLERLEGVPPPAAAPTPAAALVSAPPADPVMDGGGDGGGRDGGLPGYGEASSDAERAAPAVTTSPPPRWSAAAAPGARGYLTFLSHSSGNHGQAVAAAAAAVGARAHIVVPAASAAVKRAAIKAYGGTITTCAAGMVARRAAVARLLHPPAVAAAASAVSSADALPIAVAAAAGSPSPPLPELRVLVDPHNSADVIAGHGTLALELLAQAPTPLDALIVPVGSGSMLAGVAAVVRSAAATPAGRPVRLFGAQPAVAAAAAASLAAGRRVANDPVGAATTVADGLRADLCAAGWAALARGDVEEVLLVGEPDIGGWMRVVWERLKVMIEPSAAVGVAAAAGERFGRLGMRHVGVVLCGGNVDLGAPLPWQRGGI